jgi:hypothetical protein
MLSGTNDTPIVELPRDAKDADSDATGIGCKEHQVQGMLEEDVCFYPREHTDEFPP